MSRSSSDVRGAPKLESDADTEGVAQQGSDPYINDSDASQAGERAEPPGGSRETAPADAGPSPTGDSPPSDGSVEGSALAGVATALEGLEARVEEFHVRAQNYEHIIRQMQSRIEQLQSDQVQALLKPVIQKFAGLHAQAAEAAQQARNRGESAEKDFSFFTVAIEEALGLVDIESVQAAPSVDFDSHKHHASRIVSTDEPELDKRIQRVLRQGFTYAGAPRVFLPAQVSVYRYEPPPASKLGDASDDHNPATSPPEEKPVD